VNYDSDEDYVAPKHSETDKQEVEDSDEKENKKVILDLLMYVVT
jgi:hypothetical protein